MVLKSWWTFECSIVCIYMTKTWPVSTQVLKLEKNNSIKQMSQKHNCSFTSLGKCSKATYLYVRCMYGGLSVHLKGKLESGILINGMITKCECGKHLLKKAEFRIFNYQRLIFITQLLYVVVYYGWNKGDFWGQSEKQLLMLTSSDKVTKRFPKNCTPQIIYKWR